jgi:hypothetical protein
VNNFDQMVEARREGPKPLNIVIKLSKIKQIKQQRQLWRKFFRTSENKILGTSQGEYHPQVEPLL